MEKTAVAWKISVIVPISPNFHFLRAVSPSCDFTPYSILSSAPQAPMSNPPPAVVIDHAAKLDGSPSTVRFATKES